MVPGPGNFQKFRSADISPQYPLLSGLSTPTVEDLHTPACQGGDISTVDIPATLQREHVDIPYTACQDLAILRRGAALFNVTKYRHVVKGG